MIKRAYAYLRVSTFQQVDGKSLTGQEEEIRKYCNVYGIELVDVYSDEGKSGKSIEGRLQFQKMLRDIKEKQEVDYVIVWKLSRFGRNACDSLNSLNILQDNGVNLVALTENVDTATPMGRLVFTLLAALAEMERENIREQTANGLKYNALSGGWNGGIPPYGYDAVNKELVINEEEAAVVRKIFEWYLESEEASCDSVTGRLNEEGIKPRHYKRVDRKATEESETDETVYMPPVADWYTSQVKKILDNPTVCGKIRYGYHKTDDGGNKGKQSGDSENDYILVDGKHEAIISEEMWNRAQEKRKKSRKPRGRRDSTSENVNNVFNGIVKCPQCGAHMINYGSRYKRVNGEESYYSTYVCGYWNNHKKGKCRKNPIKTEILEKAVIGGLREYTRRPNLAEEIHQYMEQELDTGKLEKETEELKNKIAALDKNEDMQYKILCQIGVNPTYQNMKPERIQINLDKIAAEKNELQERLDYKMKQIESVQLEKMDFELVKNLLENFNEVYEDAPKELRKRLVRSLIKEVQLGYDDKGKVVPVKMILKFSGEQIELMKEYKENFGLNEAHAEPEDLRDFLASLASYVLACDVTLKDGETIGFSADDKHTITRSAGVSLPEEQMTLKIGWEPLDSESDDSSDDDYVVEMDDANGHLETIEEKALPVDEINAYNHMAIYLRWCMEHDLMDKKFLVEYGEVVEKVKVDPDSVGLREFIRDELDGQLVGPLFNKIGRAFASYYYGEPDSPYFPSDIDNYAISVIGQERNYSEEIQDEAYLFIPFDEDYYQAMAEVIGERFENWKGQNFDEDTLEPSEVAQAIMEYLDCECTYFPAMADDDPIMAAYSYAKRDSFHDGFVPILIRADDETLLECLVMNADPDHDVDCYEFDLKTVEEYRKKMIEAPVKDGKAVLEELTGQRKEEAEDDDMNWEEKVLGEMKDGYENCRFSSYWDSDCHMTYPLILAKIPVKNPWELFAYLPFGNWNECPDTPELMAVAKYWFEQYGAIPAAMSHDELEFLLPTPVTKEKAMEVATEQYGFCPDIVNQEQDAPTVGNLADVLWQSTAWYFWWD